MKLRVVLAKEPKNLLGRSMKIFLKVRSSDKAAFNFYCNEVGADWIAGHDDESLNLRIDLNDIEFIIG